MILLKESKKGVWNNKVFWFSFDPTGFQNPSGQKKQYKCNAMGNKRIPLEANKIRKHLVIFSMPTPKHIIRFSIERENCIRKNLIVDGLAMMIILKKWFIIFISILFIMDLWTICAIGDIRPIQVFFLLQQAS